MEKANDGVEAAARTAIGAGGGATSQDIQEDININFPLVAPRSDPPGYAVPQVRQMEWWVYQQNLQQEQKFNAAKRRQLLQLQPPKLKPGAPKVIPEEPPQSHSYKDYIRSQKQSRQRRVLDDSDADSTFSWVPAPTRAGVGSTSPSGFLSTYRSRQAQEVFDAAVPKRSWSIDNDEEKDDPPTRSEQTVVTDFDNSWVMPLPTTKRKEDEEEIDEEVIEDDDDEEVLVDEDGNTIEEEILEEEVEVDEDGNDIIEEEIVDEEEVVSASSASQTNTSEDTQELLAKNKTILNKSQHSVHAEPNEFMPPSNKKSVQLPSRMEYSSSSATSSSMSGSSSHRRRPTPRMTKAPRSLQPPSSGSNSSSTSYTPSSSATESSGSTQVIYIRDPRDLDEIVQKCFDGGRNVQIVDDPNPPVVGEDDDSEFVPSKRLLIVLGLLVALVALSIILGVSIYFTR